MTTATISDSVRHEPELLGQTVVVIGGSDGIGLERAVEQARDRVAAQSISCAAPATDRRDCGDRWSQSSRLVLCRAQTNPSGSRCRSASRRAGRRDRAARRSSGGALSSVQFACLRSPTGISSANRAEAYTPARACSCSRSTLRWTLAPPRTAGNSSTNTTRSGDRRMPPAQRASISSARSLDAVA
jgi:hypothetical protein